MNLHAIFDVSSSNRSRDMEGPISTEMIGSVLVEFPVPDVYFGI